MCISDKYHSPLLGCVVYNDFIWFCDWVKHVTRLAYEVVDGEWQNIDGNLADGTFYQ